MQIVGLRRGIAGAVAVAVVAVLCAWSAAIASAATGTLVICKAPDGGAAGQTFGFTATKGTKAVSISLTGGSCSQAASVAAGTWTVSEDLTGGWTMAHVSVQPSGALVSTFKKQGRLKVAVTAGQETRVTVVNAGAGSLLKICTWSSAPTLEGIVFHFAVGGDTVGVPAGGSSATAGCSHPITVQPGSHVQITEAVPTGVAVTAVSVGPGTTLTSSAGGAVEVTVAAGTNVVTFQNEVAVPPPTGGDQGGGNQGGCGSSGCGGWGGGGLKICKVIDPGSLASIGGRDYTFTWSDLLGNSGSGTVHPPYPGAQDCTGLMGNVPIVLPNGSPNAITVTEQASSNVVVSSVDVSNGTNKTVAGRSVTFYPGPGVVVVTFTNRWATG
jgi:hypothetical protein